MVRSFSILLIVLVSGISAQPLAERVPADALLYVGWRGAADPGTGYDSSRLKQILDQSNIRAAVNEFLPRAMKRIGQTEPQSAEAMDLINAVGAALWKYPTVLYVAGVDWTNPEGPAPMVALLCKAGADSKSVEARLSEVFKKAHRVPPQLELFSNEQFVGLTFAADAQSAPQSSLANDAQFNDLLKSTQTDPALVVSVNFSRVWAVIEEAVAMDGKPRQMEKWHQVRDALGILGLQNIVCTAGFEGRDWTSHTFIKTTGERKGILKLLEGKPLSEDLLKQIPADSVMAFGGALDLAGLIGSIRQTVGEIDPNAVQQVDQVIGAVSMYIGRNLETEVLAPLGEHWVGYASPSVAGGGLLGLVMMNQPDDLKKAEQGAMSTMLAICNSVNGQVPGRKVQFRIEKVKVGELGVNYLATPLVSPAWTSANGRMYFGLYPQTAAAAARRPSNDGKSLLDNPDFAELRKWSDAGKLSGFSYTDLRTGAGDAYQGMLMLSRLGLGIGDLFGVKSPELVIPTFDVLQPHFTYAGSVSWTDQDGWHQKAREPFPGASLMSGRDASAIAGVVALQTSILLPSLNRARETANRVKCASNLRQMGQLCLLYANDHKGKYPETAKELYRSAIADYDLVGEVFLCPSNTTSLPQNFKAMTPDEKAAWLAEHSDYIYVGGGKTVSAPAEAVIMYEKMVNHDQDGFNALFADGHVEWNNRNVMDKVLQAGGVKPADAPVPSGRGRP